MPFGRRPATRVDGILVAGAGADVKKSARLRQGRAKGRSLYRESIDAANDQARNLALGFKSHFATRSWLPCSWLDAYDRKEQAFRQFEGLAAQYGNPIPRGTKP